MCTQLFKTFIFIILKKIFPDYPRTLPPDQILEIDPFPADIADELILRECCRKITEDDQVDHALIHMETISGEVLVHKLAQLFESCSWPELIATEAPFGHGAAYGLPYGAGANAPMSARLMASPSMGGGFGGTSGENNDHIVEKLKAYPEQAVDFMSFLVDRGNIGQMVPILTKYLEMVLQEAWWEATCSSFRWSRHSFFMQKSSLFMSIMVGATTQSEDCFFLSAVDVKL